MSCKEGHQDNLNILESYLHLIDKVTQSKYTALKENMQTTQDRISSGY